MWLAHPSGKRIEKTFNGYPKSRQQHDATIDKLKSENETPLKPSFKVLLIRGFIMIVYLLLGGLVFSALEHEESVREVRDSKLIIARKSIIREFNISEERLQIYENLVRSRRGEPKYWDYYQSVYFASTVTTTIGYGHITPQTQGGRIFLIIFALIGIPLNILALASVGEHITVAIFHFLRYISTCCFKTPRIKHINIKVMLVSMTLMICMLFLGGLLYCTTEDWNYIDSMYYCFVALATIGFGDLVPNDGLAPDSEKEKAMWFLRALYISIGLSLVSTVFTAISNAIEEINFLLGRQKYEDWDDQNKSVRNASKKFKRSKGNLEKISYKHKIQKHGSTVFKYKFLHKLKRRKEENIIQSDWDSLLEESKRKHTNHTDIVKNSELMLANHRGFSSNAYRDMNTVITSDGDTMSTNVTEMENEPQFLNQAESVLSRSRDEITPLPKVPRYVHRMSSMPISSHQRDHSQHNLIKRTSSQPVEYHRQSYQRASTQFHNRVGKDNKQTGFVLRDNNNNQQFCQQSISHNYAMNSSDWSSTMNYPYDTIEYRNNLRSCVFRQSHSTQEFDNMNQC